MSLTSSATSFTGEQGQEDGGAAAGKTWLKERKRKKKSKYRSTSGYSRVTATSMLRAVI